MPACDKYKKIYSIVNEKLKLGSGNVESADARAYVGVYVSRLVIQGFTLVQAMLNDKQSLQSEKLLTIARYIIQTILAELACSGNCGERAALGLLEFS